MTYNQAKLIIWNAAAYPRDKVRDAAIYIMGTISAKPEDVDQAIRLL